MKRIIKLISAMVILMVGVAYAETYRYHFKDCDTVWTPECIPDRDIQVYSFFSVKQCQEKSRLSSDPFIICSSTLAGQQIYYNGTVIDEARFRELSLNLYHQSSEYKEYLQSKQKRIKEEKDSQKRLPYVLGSICLLLVLSIIGIVKGYKEEIIFFYNYWDFSITSLSVPITITLGIYWNNLIQTRSGNAIFSNGILILLGLIWFVSNYLVLSRNSKGVWNILCVVLGRLTIGLTAFLLIFMVLQGPGGKRERESDGEYIVRQATGWLVIIGMVTGYVNLVRKLVNGKEVMFKDATRIVSVRKAEKK